MKTAELALALGATFLQLSLLILLSVRGFYRYFPGFFAYIGFSVASTALGLAARNNPTAYLRVYWLSEALYVLLAFGALLDVFKSAFRSFYHLPWFRFLFPGIGVL